MTGAVPIERCTPTLTTCGAVDIAPIVEAVRERASRWLGVTTLLALLLVPLTLGTHTHADGHAARSCSACVVAHHAPPVAANAPTVSPPTANGSRLRIVDAVAGSRQATPARTGRAPPTSPTPRSI